MSTALLQLSSVETDIGGSRILRGVDLEVNPGEVVALMGRNGVGKTTTLRSITGVLPIRAGAITFAGQPIQRLSSDARARLGIGYVPQGRDIEHVMYQYKLQSFARLKEYFARHFTPRTPLVWLGDLNVAPEAMDIHNAEEQEDHVCYHVDVRRAFADVVRWGFVDVFRKHRPEPGQYTFFDYRTPNAAKRGMGWRIDHILATAPLAAKSAAAYVDLAPRLGPKPSDHTFLAAEFDV